MVKMTGNVRGYKRNVDYVTKQVICGKTIASICEGDQTFKHVHEAEHSEQSLFYPWH